ncbi:MAG: protein-L-isoaspartate O-methyltransferase [Ignavibacteriales bacterium CG12_big_fil_rev_8_21_14_0_65_30_8]|nr:MAG: protein-L-isoaspartate O-methyltransferase [Ignavibacteriales bacterium CG12_big_fil_rev_8_21_14_0_65_30_8]
MYKTDRKLLVDELKTKGIIDINVLKAIGEVKREKFIPEAIKHYAYKDVALPIGFGQTISQPYTVAFMTELLSLKEKSKVLEIGTGSGYQAALLFDMGMEVYSIERNFDIFSETLKLFDQLRIRVKCKCGDGTLGWKDKAPFDGIIVTAGSPSIPNELKNQLSINGKLVIPVGDKDTQILKVITKEEDDLFLEENYPQFKFVPLIGRDGWKEA